MTDKVVSLEETVDVAIRKAVRVFAILSFPALLISFYRNLYLDFLPSHQLVLSLIWTIIVILSTNLKLIDGHRLNALVAIIFLLFVFVSVRNDSTVVGSTFFLLAIGLMSFQHSIKLITLVSITIFLLTHSLTRETILFGFSYEFGIIYQLLNLSIYLVLIFAIKKIVGNYVLLHEEQTNLNSFLIDKNKTSYLQVAEAIEDVNAEKERLEYFTVSVSSFLKRLYESMELAKEKKDNMLSERCVHEINEIRRFIEDGANCGDQIRHEAHSISLAEFSEDLTHYFELHNMCSRPYLDISQQDTSAIKTRYLFQSNLCKLMAHHVVEYFLENHLIEKLNFDIMLGRKMIDKQQIYINACGSLIKIQHENFSENITKKDTDKIISGRDRNIYFAEKVIKQMSGNLSIEKSENSVICDLNFWVPIVRD
jgi:hypothetical protein